MGPFGSELKRQRELRHISLQEISEETKISLRFLEALEDNRFEYLPGGMYRVAFIRAYARSLGMNADELASGYRSYLESLKAEGDPKKQTKVIESSPRRSPVISWLILGLVALILAGSGWTLWKNRSEWKLLKHVSPQAPTYVDRSPSRLGRAREAPAAVPSSTPLPEPAKPREGPTPAASPGPAIRPAALASPPTELPRAEAPLDTRSGLTLELLANQVCWVAVQIDGSENREALLQPGEKYLLTARERMELTVGNSGGVSLRVNGLHAGSLGESGKVRHLSLTTTNYQTFIPGERP